jgi:hypothetical protein
MALRNVPRKLYLYQSPWSVSGKGEKKEARGRSRSRLTVREKSDIKSDTELVEPRKVLPHIVPDPAHLK